MMDRLENNLLFQILGTASCLIIPIVLAIVGMGI